MSCKIPGNLRGFLFFSTFFTLIRRVLISFLSVTWFPEILLLAITVTRICNTNRYKNKSSKDSV